MRSMKMKESRALTILVSWLDAVKVPYELSSSTDRDLTVGAVPVKIVVDRPTAGTDIRADDLTAPLDKALKVFWTITEAAGFGKPRPVDRGIHRCLRCHQPLAEDAETCPNIDCRAESPNKVKAEDAPELVAIRHREFRQVANLPASVYHNDDYKKIMKWYCHKFYRHYMQLCQDMAFDVDDLETYAMIYLTNFYGRWRKIDSKKGENGKMFCSYLQQRFYSDLLPLLKRKSQSIVVDEETVSLGLDIHHVKQYESGQDSERGSAATFCAVKNDQESDVFQEIAELDHDEFLDILQSKSGTDSEPEVRRKAVELLYRHWMSCQTCNPFDFEEDFEKFSHDEQVALVKILMEDQRHIVKSMALHFQRTHKSSCKICMPSNMVEKFFDELPDMLDCKKCQAVLPKVDIGIRVMKRNKDGSPKYVSRQSYCKKCRRTVKPLAPPGDAGGVQVNEDHAGADPLSG